MAETFTCHRALAPMLWVLFALACVELVVVHLLLAVWWPRVAAIASALTAASLVWLALAIRSLRTFPSRVDEEGLCLRAGRLRGVTIPRANVGGLRAAWDAAAVREPGVVNLAVAAYPNVLLDLAAPISRRGRAIRAVAHRLDDPAGFAAAIERLGAGHG